MEKNIYKFIQLAILGCIASSCITKPILYHNNIIESKKVIMCNENSSCLEILECCDGIQLKGVENGKDKFSSECSKKHFLSCAVLQAQKGNIEMHGKLIDFYQMTYENWLNDERNPALIFSESYSYTTQVFGAMRGEDAFSLALKFAAKNEQYHDGHGKCIDVGLVVIENILFPMIKSVGKFPSLSAYLFSDNKSNATYMEYFEDFSTPCSESDYNFFILELTKAWNEGIIDLKGYGELSYLKEVKIHSGRKHYLEEINRLRK